MKTVRRVDIVEGKNVNMYMLMDDPKQVIGVVAPMTNSLILYLPQGCDKTHYKNKAYTKLIAKLKRRHGVGEIAYTGISTRLD